MKYEIAKKIPRGAQEGTIRADFPVKFQAEGRQVSVNRKSMSLLAMKYAIGKNCFHVLRTRALGWWAARERRSQGLSQGRSEGPGSKLAMNDSIG